MLCRWHAEMGRKREKLDTVNQQILAAIKFGVSQNKVIWRLLNLASPLYAVYDQRNLRMLARQILAKTRNSTNIIAHQNLLIYSMNDYPWGTGDNVDIVRNICGSNKISGF